jgi:hypothetical protein
MIRGYQQPMRLILAARLSRRSDGQTGIETQDEDAREWAEANGHTIVAVAKDTKSGTAAMGNRSCPYGYL